MSIRHGLFGTLLSFVLAGASLAAVSPPSMADVPGGAGLGESRADSDSDSVCHHASCSWSSSAVSLSAGGPGASLTSATTLATALPIRNDGTAAAEDVTVTSITLPGGTLLSPVSLPIDLGDIAAESSAVLHASFSGQSFTPGSHLTMTVEGTYRSGGVTHCFAVDGALFIPPASPGSAPVHTTTQGSHQVSGAPFCPQPADFDDEVNGSAWEVPIGPFVPGTPTATGTDAMAAPIGGPPAVVFRSNNGIGITNGSTIAEPSGASNGGGMIFVTANSFAAFSTNGGATFRRLDPTTIFPADAVGFCCDQIVQYVPSIDRFVWLLQGNGMRLAVATPQDIITSGGTAWTYWNLTAELFGQPAGTGLDYPDLSVGNNSLYLSWDNGWPACPAGCSQGLQVSRISLAGLRAGGTITIDFTTPADSIMAWGSHLMQDTEDEIFWAGHNTDSSMRIFSWAEGSGTYFWRDVAVSTWSTTGLSSTVPDGADWLTMLRGFPGNAVIGATRLGNQLWFAWSAGTDRNFRQPHVEMVTLNRNADFGRIQQVQVWNDSYAFAYPALATNGCTREIGFSMEYGGNGNYQNHVVGFWGDFLAYITTGSDTGTTRFGDYVTIRQRPSTLDDPGNLFDAFGYGLNTAPGGGTLTDIHHVVFGRPPATCD